MTMSLFGALYTAVSGLGAQAAAFGNISDNVANSQTIGFKETNTAFIDYLTTSTATINDSGSVVTRPDYTNNVQGTVTSSTDPTALAISGGGFFAVQEATGTAADGTAQFSPEQYYTRAGDFSLNAGGYLQNSTGQYLQGWNVDPANGVVDQTKLQTIRVSSSQFNPVATSTVALSANLPATPSATSTTSSEIQVYDSLGTVHTLNVNWTQNAPSNWTATITAPDNAGGAVIGSADVVFGPSSGNSVSAGTIGAITGTTGSVGGSTYGPTSEATLTANANFGNGNQAITIDIGGFGSATGVTQFAGTSYDLHTVTQDGAAPGSYSGITINSGGSVIANYDNGQSRILAQVPLAIFANPDALQRQSGQGFTATSDSGLAIEHPLNSNQAGGLVVGSVESSNVDIAAEFSKLIVAQQAYGANTKVVTTASDMLTQTIDMKR
jgi:flagellar hook protein FlgE